MKIIERLDKPTKADLIEVYNNLSGLEIIIFYIVTKINYNLFVFIAGIFASYSINLLTNLVGFKVGDLVYFSLYLLSIICSLSLTICFILFTIRYIELQDIAGREINMEKYINKTFEACNNNLIYLKDRLILSILFSILTLIGIVACFIRINI